MQKRWFHLMFVALCAGILLVLSNAPEETTPRLPATADHANPHDFPACPACHGTDSDHPMADNHLGIDGALRGDHFKCYMCHKPQKR